MTALAVVSLVEDGALELATTARSILGDDLPLIDDDVTVEHLLAHRSGIGDYLDEDVETDVTDYLLPVPVHQLATTEEYLAVLDGHPTKFAPGERFSYCNGGFVVLALIAERASGIPFHELVAQRVCEPAGMRDTAFLRSDELPGRAALGYLAADGLRTNVLHLPVRGSGDGGIYTTAADIRALWAAFFAGEIVSPDWVAEMTGREARDRERDRERARYGLGFWLHASTDDGVPRGLRRGRLVPLAPRSACRGHRDRHLELDRRRLADREAARRAAAAVRRRVAGGGDRRPRARRRPRRARQRRCAAVHRLAVDRLTLEQQVGQLIVLSFTGTTPPAYVREPCAGAVSRG